MGKLFLALAVAGCAGCASVNAAYVAPVLEERLPSDKYATTSCSWNNLPVIRVQPEVLASPDAEIILAHERVHAERMFSYRGGCWPYMYRYSADTAFKRQEQMLAYCAEGKAAIERNKVPQMVWERIKALMKQYHGAELSAIDNCLYEER